MKIYFLLIFFLFTAYVFSQRYFQQEVNYSIYVELDDKKHELFADETIEYINNSPDTLKFLYFHLWPNAYKNKNTAFAKQCLDNGNADFYFASANKLGYIDNLDFKVNNEKVSWSLDSVNIDICKLILNKPLFPKDKILISTPFHVKVPNNFSRIGYIEDSYQITQWYPKPAVYDKLGWHPMPYLDQGEFYSEFGSFDVTIVVPKNYVVAATGTLQNEKGIKWLKKRAEKSQREFGFMTDYKNVKTDTIYKTLYYTLDSIHDFAWFADKQFLVVNSNVVLQNSGNNVNTWSFFTSEQAELWKKSTTYINDALKYYSKWIGDYPFDNCTAVMCPLGTGGGMEYPTITAIGYMGDTISLEQTIMHEVGHNWFYGILGSNERDNPWLDEGLNSFYEMRYFYTKYPKLNLAKSITELPQFFFRPLVKYPSYYMNYLLYLIIARQHNDQSCNLGSDDYPEMNYGNIVYNKTAYLINYLMNYLGEDEFDRIIKLYFEKWKFKHPQPEDFQQIFKDNCNIDLNWFFDDALKSTKKIDYKIVSLKKGMDPLSFTGDCWDLTVSNIGDIPAPFPVSAINNDSIVSTKWIDGFAGTKTIKLHFIDFDKLVIDARWVMPDFQRKNNTIKKKGLFKKVEPLSFKLFPNIEDPDRTQLFYLPVMGWNSYNKTMAGILLYNNIFPARKLEYQLMPMYSFGKDDLAGTGKVNYTMYPESGIIHDVNLSISAMQYAWENSASENFQRYKANADFTLQTDIKEPIEAHFIVNSIAATDIVYKKNDINFYENFILKYQNNRVINPFGILLSAQVAKGFVKCKLEADYKITYNKVSKGLFVHFFCGKFLFNETNKSVYNFNLSGTSGYYDYTYDDIFLGRTKDIRVDTNNIFAHQFVKSDGGFTLYTPLGHSADWLTSLNFSTTIPMPLPIRIYANLASFSQINIYKPNSYFTWETGLEIRIIPDILTVYLPLFLEESIKSTNEMYSSSYLQKIRFTLDLNKLNVFELKRKKLDLSGF